MRPAPLEKRVAILEAELAELKTRLEGTGSPKPWWERIAGTFQNDPIYEKAMKLGHQYRRLQKPHAASPKKN